MSGYGMRLVEPERTLYVRSMGKALRVTSIFTDSEAANAHMARSPTREGVVAVFGPFILLANVYEPGIPFPITNGGNNATQ